MIWSDRSKSAITQKDRMAGGRLSVSDSAEVCINYNKCCLTSNTFWQPAKRIMASASAGYWNGEILSETGDIWS